MLLAPKSCARLVDLEELDLELEGRVGGNDRGEASSTVGCASEQLIGSLGHGELTEVRGAGEHGLLAKGELRNTLVPALDDSADTLAESQQRLPRNSRQQVAEKERLTMGVTKGDPRSRDESNLEPSRRVPTSALCQQVHYVSGSTSTDSAW